MKCSLGICNFLEEISGLSYSGFRSTAAKRSYTMPRTGVATESARLRWHRSGQEELPNVRDRGGGQEVQLHVQGAVAALEQEGLEELLHI